jgi:hypothetical protein
MSFEFEQALRDKCQQNPDLSVLVSQWDYDKRLVTDALQIVGLTFPHYSRHDASHSNTILIQLARILGPERIKKLSATDIWLLLEAAYQHDIGMVVTTEQAKKWWDSNEFKGFLAMLRMGPDHNLRDAAELLSDSARVAALGPDWPLQVAQARTLVLADYARRQHPLNAERIVRDPSQIGLASPRNSLIPRRLFDVLGRICAHHGRTFDETMKLPARESGLGTDDAHPLFVACMLRLGDLLDLDNNRFCPIMVRSFGQLPASSLAHFEKHAAVTRLDVTTTIVEAEAECPNYESYEVTDQWFSWLREELKDQMATWSKITPAPDFGALPSVGAISARITGHIALEPGRRPRFEVDREAMVSLVKGANIYEDPFSCIRELLQNAVDATLIRLWRDEWSTKPKEELDQLEPKDLRKALEKYPVRIRFDRKSDASSGNDAVPNKIRWRVTIEDAGTGISLDDVRHMQRIGGSKKNQVRQLIIQEMPEWIRPSGIFGIGLQSVFLFTDTVTLTTRHYETHEALQIELRNESRKDGAPDGFSIKHLGTNDERELRAGTRVTFNLDVDRIPEWADETIGSESERVVREFDPIAHDEMPYEIARAKDQARNFAEACPCPIEMDRVLLLRSDQNLQGFHFDRQSGLEIFMEAGPKQHVPIVQFYRGAPLSRVNYYHHMSDLLRIRCDVYAGRADELLRLDREGFTHEGDIAIRERLRGAIGRQFPTYLQKLRARHSSADADVEIKFASLYAYLEDLSINPLLVGKDWGDISVTPKGLKIDDILKRPLVHLKEVRLNHLLPSTPIATRIIDISDTHVSLEVEVHGPSPSPPWLRLVLQRNFGYPTLVETEKRERQVLVTYAFDRTTPSTVLTDAGLSYVLGDLVPDWEGSRGRVTIPCPSDFEALRYDVEKSNLRLIDSLEDWLRPRMVCPFMADQTNVRLPNLGKYIEWTAKHAQGGPRKPKEVAEALLAFIQHADKLMAERWGDLRKYNLTDVEHELGPWLSS